MCSELKIAIKAAKDAGDVILKYYKSKYEIKDKSYHNPVTTADKEADETIKKILELVHHSYSKLIQIIF